MAAAIHVIASTRKLSKAEKFESEAWARICADASKAGVLDEIELAWPADQFTRLASPNWECQPKFAVRLLGSFEPVVLEQEPDSLHLHLPKQPPTRTLPLSVLSLNRLQERPVSSCDRHPIKV